MTYAEAKTNLEALDEEVDEALKNTEAIGKELAKKGSLSIDELRMFTDSIIDLSKKMNERDKAQNVLYASW